MDAKINEYINFSDAFLNYVQMIYTVPTSVDRRNGDTKELISQSFAIKKPNEREIILPFRNNNIFATIAETLWVLAGRNDIEFIERYLPRAKEFSDNGKVWRAGYGPRLRSWKGNVDQLYAIYSLLKLNRYSRRAVISLFDPSEDYCDSKDIPCNNWLHFLFSGETLNLNIAVRSNDLIWGFSGINSFEWSVLLEIISYWLNMSVGTISFFIGSFHVYERHYLKAARILERNDFIPIYDFNLPKDPAFCTPFIKFDNILLEIFQAENQMRSRQWDFNQDYNFISDPLLRIFIQLLGVYNFYLAGGTSEEVGYLFSLIPSCPLKVAGIEYFNRIFKGLDWILLSSEEHKFFNQFLIL